MPTYAYRCKACLREFETEQKFSDDPLVKCPYCKKLKLVRLITGSGLVFKGSGFYLTDYKKRSTTEGEISAPASKEGGGKTAPEAPAAGKGEGDAAPESKPAGKSHHRKKK